MHSERTEILKTFDGHDIFFRCFTPAKQNSDPAVLKGLVLGIHGFGEHSGRYKDVAAKVCEKGLAYATYDVRGHGNSGPKKGDAENLHALLVDLLFVANHTKSILGLAHRQDLFFGIFGHSFGALLATYCAAILNDACPPMFFSSPCYRVLQKVPVWKSVMAAALPKLTPTLQIPLEINPHVVSNNPENNAAYMQDPLNMFNISVRYGHTFLNALNETLIRNAISLVRSPVTIIYSGDDKLVDPKMTEGLFPLFHGSNCSLTEVPGGGHELFNETKTIKDIALTHLGDWLDNRGYVK
jgi:acylglycerol lipase